MTEKNERKVVKKFSISYEVKEFLRKPAPFFFIAMVANILSVFAILVYFRDIISFASSSSLQVLGTVVESSATILGIFFALVIFFFERKRRHVDKGVTPREPKKSAGIGEFFSACVTFSLSIILGVNNMLIIEPNTRVDGTVVFVPAYLLIASLFFLFLFAYRILKRGTF